MPSPHLVTNDNSNPQQGTGSIVLMKSASEVSAAEGVSINSNVNLVETNSSNSNNSTKEQLNTPPTTEEVRKLFVGGLPTDITEPEFRAFFQQFGELHDCVVMFDRETDRSRGFGFVTYVDPEVAKSLLRMGDQDDGVGRLVMRGKTCEVKAATPKGDGGFGRGARNIRSGSYQKREQRKHDNYGNNIGYGPMPDSYAYLEHMAYIPVMHDGVAYSHNPQLQEYHGTAISDAGVPPFMTPVYYPSVPYPHTHPSFVMPPPPEEYSHGGSAYNMVPPTPDAAAHFAVPLPHHLSATTPGGVVPMTSPPAPLLLPMHHSPYQQHHQHLTPAPYSQQQAAYTFLPVAPMPPRAGVAPGPPPGVVVQAASVMQPVAPGLPYKQQHDISSHNDMENNIGGSSVTQK